MKRITRHEWVLKEIVKSKNSAKKFDAYFYDEVNGKTKKVSFGASGYSDFTKHKDELRKQRYILRHARNESWDNPLTPGALSRWILWNKPTLQESIADYKKRFKV